MMAIATREAAPSHLLLKIESVSLLNKHQVDKYESPEFHAGNYKWRLIIYPNGHGNEKPGEYVSVYLAISGTDYLPVNWEVNAVFSIFILNQISGNYHHTIGSTRRFFGLKTKWGVPNFMSKKDLISPLNGYLIDDCYMFGAEVFVIDNTKVETRCLSLKDVQLVPYKHAIKISHFSKLKQDIWYSEEFIAGGYKWKILLYPKGSTQQVGRSLSIFLTYVPLNTKNSGERVKARFSVCMKNQLDSTKDLKHTYSNRFDASIFESWGWPSFILLDELKAAGGGFIVNDTCLLEVELFVQDAAQ